MSQKEAYNEESERRRKNAFKARLIVVVSTIFGTFGAFSLGFPNLVFPELDKGFVGPFSFAFVGVALASLVLLYLQSGSSADKRDRGYEESLQKHEESLSEIREDFKRISDGLNELKDRLPDTFQRDLGEFNKQQAIEQITKNIGADSIKAIFTARADALTKEIHASIIAKHGSSSAHKMIERLTREISDLRLRSNVNLALGMLITAVGVYLLWTTVSMIDMSESLKSIANDSAVTDSLFFRNLALPLLPRITLVVFIEIFAYFFLRLYRDGLAEIKYFQNELTNVQSKVLAVEMAISSGSLDVIPVAFAGLAQTERNFILQKDQTTVELEKAKSESELTRNVLKAIPSLFKQKK